MSPAKGRKDGGKEEVAGRIEGGRRREMGEDERVNGKREMVGLNRRRRRRLDRRIEGKQW